eukprot:TRINITY_DN4239_c0_g1_i3.p1 TRINITY_DN4239_c0_g1~~TRINITY_DN4239_c0_g1_i3.p1  ORF type:complete len:462 (+),score=129.82 TRINITY_DN4239_c0_g1_i3:162-1547(+)
MESKAVKIRVEEANWIQEHDLVLFKMVVEGAGRSKDIEFALNLIEDTEPAIAREMVRELSLPKELTDFTTLLIRNEVARISKERELIRWKELYDKAMRYHKDGKWKEAEYLFAILFDSFNVPVNRSGPIPMKPPVAKSEVQMRLGDSRYKLGKHQEARHLYEAYMQLGEESRQKNSDIIAHVKLGKILMKENKFSESEALLKSIINRPPKQMEGAAKELEYCRKTLSKVYEVQGKLYESEMLYKRLVDDIWSSFQVLEKNAQQLMLDGSFEQAQELFKDELKLKGEVLPFLERLAELYSRHNKFMESLDCHMKCLELKEKLNDAGHFSLAKSLNSIGNVYKIQGKHDLAEESYSKAIKIVEMALKTMENLILKLSKENASAEKVTYLTSKLPEIRQLLLTTLQNLIEIHDCQSHKAEAKALKKKLNEISAGTSPTTPIFDKKGSAPGTPRSIPNTPVNEKK